MKEKVSTKNHEHEWMEEFAIPYCFYCGASKPREHSWTQGMIEHWCSLCGVPWLKGQPQPVGPCGSVEER